MTELPHGTRRVDAESRHVVIEDGRAYSCPQPFILHAHGIDFIGLTPSAESQDQNLEVIGRALSEPLTPAVARKAGLDTIARHFSPLAAEAAADLPDSELGQLFVAVGRWLQGHGLEVIQAAFTSPPSEPQTPE